MTLLLLLMATALVFVLELILWMLMQSYDVAAAGGQR